MWKWKDDVECKDEGGGECEGGVQGRGVNMKREVKGGSEGKKWRGSWLKWK
jgi:hypothetical protein